jgi:uncharacterized damage-inducible protein DinB
VTSYGRGAVNAGIVEMLRYNKWANQTLLEACRSLGDAELSVVMPGTSGSTRELLVHIVGAEQTYVLRTRGRQHEGELNRGSAWPGIDDLIAIVRETSDQLVTIAEQLDPDAEVDLPYQGAAYRFPTRFFLVHAAEHGVEHRTEVKVNLAQLGIETPDLDGWSYADFAGYGTEIQGRSMRPNS